MNNVSKLRPESKVASDPEMGRWLAEQLKAKRQWVTLRHEDGDEAPIIDSWPLEEASIGDLAGRIHTRALREASQLRGSHVFALYAFERDDRPAASRWTFRLVVDDGAESYGGVRRKGGATEAHVLAMALDHADRATRLAISHTERIIEQYSGQIATAMDRIAQLEDGYTMVYKLREEFESRKHDRDIERMRLGQKEKRMHLAMEKFGPLLPAFLQIVSGGKLALGKDGMLGEQQVHELLGSLTPAQIQAIMSSLTPEQAIGFHTLYEAYCARAVEAQEKAAAAAKATADAEEDPSSGERSP